MKIIKLTKRIIQDNRGYGVAELLLVLSISVTLCSIVVSHIRPGLCELDDHARNTITGIAGGGKNN